MKLNPEQIAKIAYAAVAKYMEITEAAALPAWEVLSQDYRNGLIEDAAAGRGATSHRDYHEAWRKQQEADGWKFGAERDEAKKTHPFVCPYDELPDSVRHKAALCDAIRLALSEK